MRMRVIAMVAAAGLGCGGNKDDATVEVKPGATRLPADDVSEAAYAEMLIAGLKAHGGKPELHFVAATNEITDGDVHVATRNLYAEYLKLPAAERPAQIARTVATFSDMGAADKLSLDAVRAKLLPAVRAGMYFDFGLQFKAKTQLNAKAPTRAEFVPIGEVTGIGIAIDQPTAMQIATDKQLEDWKLSATEALAIATANLVAQNVAFVELSPGVWTSPAHDNYDASRLLLVDAIKKLKLKGPPVALIPNRDTLLITGAQDAKGLLAMADLAEKAAEEPRPIHTVPLCLAGTTWSDCEPAPTPAVKQRMHALALAGRASLYEEQHDALQEAVGEDIFVAKLTVMQDKASTRQISYATWTKTVPTLLPHADFIALMDVTGDDAASAKILGLVPWDRAQAVLGAKLVRDGHNPPRWATGSYFPSAADMVKLAPTKDLFGP